MIKLTIHSISLAKTRPTQCAFFAYQKEINKKTVLNPLSWSKEDNKKIEALKEEKIFEGKFGEFVTLRKHIDFNPIQTLLLVGLGNERDLTEESFRKIGSHFVTQCKNQKIKELSIYFPASLYKKIKVERLTSAFSEGAYLTSYSFEDHKSEETKKDYEIKLNLIFEKIKDQRKINHVIQEAKTLSESINFARWLSDQPGNLMTPAKLAQYTTEASKGSKLKVTSWDKARIKKENMGCLLGVSLGSNEEPRFIIMEYKGGAAKNPPICFVGKGLTFDSGGISIKPSQSMEEMKFDMCGGAAVIATMVAISKLKLKINVIAFVPSSENMPGPDANKPGDILKARNGKTVEVNNTDAEGRLILADALSYASEQKPRWIVDAATLTGAMVISLGDIHTGYFCKNEVLNKKIQKAALASQEKIWQLPLVEEHVDDMKGTYAQLSNMANNRGAGSAHGAAFLEQFVEKNIPWAHFDIAGTSYNTGHRLPYCPKKGSSGTIIRTFIELARNEV